MLVQRMHRGRIAVRLFCLSIDCIALSVSTVQRGQGRKSHQKISPLPPSPPPHLNYSSSSSPIAISISLCAL